MVLEMSTVKDFTNVNRGQKDVKKSQRRSRMLLCRITLIFLNSNSICVTGLSHFLSKFYIVTKSNPKKSNEEWAKPCIISYMLTQNKNNANEKPKF